MLSLLLHSNVYIREQEKKFTKYRSASISERDLSHPVAVVLDSLRRLGRENSSGGVGRRRRRRGAGGAAVEEALVVGATLVLIQIIEKKSRVFLWEWYVPFEKPPSYLTLQMTLLSALVILSRREWLEGRLFQMETSL